MSITLGTYNILNPAYAVKYRTPQGITPEGHDNWTYRKGHVFTNIRNADLDILTITEIGKKQLDDLKPMLEQIGYEVVHASHSGQSSIDGVGIIYKKSKFNRLKIRTLSNQEATGHDRKAIYVDLQDKQTKAIIRVATCHLRGGMGQKNIATWDRQAQQLYNFVAEAPTSHYQVQGTFLAGDFNRAQNTMNSQTAIPLSQGYFHDNSLQFTEYPNGYHQGRKIDWIFGKGNFSFETIVPDQQDSVGMAGSDHLLCATRIVGLQPQQQAPLAAAHTTPPITTNSTTQPKNQTPKLQKERFSFFDYFNPKKNGWVNSISMFALSILTGGLFAVFLLLYSHR